MSSADPVAVRLLEKARASRDDLEARLLLAAAVQRVATGIGVLSVVVGGTAVDFYVAKAAGTSAAYPAMWQASRDVDLVALSLTDVGAVQRLKEALVGQLGFTPMFQRTDADGQPAWSRTLDVPDFPYGLEIVSDTLGADPRAERAFIVEVEGERVYFRGPEDTLISYAESGWHFRDGRDWERALAVWRTMREEMDVEYLQRRAAERRMPGVLRMVMDQQPLSEQAGPLF